MNENQHHEFSCVTEKFSVGSGINGGPARKFPPAPGHNFLSIAGDGGVGKCGNGDMDLLNSIPSFESFSSVIGEEDGLGCNNGGSFKTFSVKSPESQLILKLKR